MGAVNMFSIVLKRRAKKIIDRLPRNEKVRIVSAIEKLPEGDDIKQLQGYDRIYRLRVGDYRILYTVNHAELIVIIIDAGSRGDIYKRY